METSIAPKTTAREKQLHSLGFSKKMFGFAFQNFAVNNYQIEYMCDIDWDIFMNYVTDQVAEIKRKLSANTSDKDKMQIFKAHLTELTGPEVKSNTAAELVKISMDLLKDLSDFLETEIKRLPDDTAAGN